MVRPLLISLLLLTGVACAGDQGPNEAIGTLHVITHTTGASPDADGYTLTVTRHGTAPIGINDTVTYAAIPIGDYVATLGDLEGGCTVPDGNVIERYVPYGPITVDYFVECP